MTTEPAIDAECLAALTQASIDLCALLGGLHDSNLAQVRATLAAMPAPPLNGAVDRMDHDVPQSDGVTVRVYRPKEVTGALPCVYWVHGGGLVLGSRDEADLRFDTWCTAHQCVGVSVEYRLAPEHRYPAALDDCLAGLRWVFACAEELGVDRGRIGIGGASAGGGLAACLALRVHDETDLEPAFQLLIYPMLDDRQITTSSQRNDRFWPPAANHYGWSSYLGDAKGGPDVSPYAAAARATGLDGLPPTYVMVGTADGFVDECVDYAERLRHSGVDVDLHLYAGAFHGFDVAAPGTALANRANSDMSAWLHAHL